MWIIFNTGKETSTTKMDTISYRESFHLYLVLYFNLTLSGGESAYWIIEVPNDKYNIQLKKMKIKGTEQ